MTQFLYFVISVKVNVNAHLLTVNVLVNQFKNSLLKPFKGRTIRRLMVGAGEVQKKYSRKGKLNEKIFLHAN